jgi:RNA polymerase sigma-70 factor (ECF subfamily)
MVRNEGARAEDLERFRPFLYRQARRQLGARLRRKLDAADLVQETLLKAHEKLGQFRGRTEAELAAWLRTILENTCAMAVRQFQAGARDVAREQSLRGSISGAASPRRARQAIPPSTPDALAMHQEQLLRLMEALQQLPQDQRRAIELHHLQGQSLAEAARQMHRSKDALIGLLFRGLRKLRQLLTEQDES